MLSNTQRALMSFKRKISAKLRTIRMRKKAHAEMLSGTGLMSGPMFTPGNPDRGCPFKGRDRFSGQWKKFNDRSYSERKSTGEVVTILMPFDNNKYNVHGGLRGV